VAANVGSEPSRQQRGERFRPGDGSAAFDAGYWALVLLRTDGAHTWSWNGLAWSPLDTATAPGPRVAPVLAYDGRTRDLVMFGGNDQGLDTSRSHDLQDTWTWTGSTWTQVRPAVSPGARQDGCAGYDPASRQLIMFGGTTPSTAVARADMWNWTGSTWVELHPATTPPGGSCAMTYDPDVGGLVLVALGPWLSDGGALPQVWIWDGSGWSQAASSLPETAGLPSLAYDTDAGALIVDEPAFHVDGGYNNNVWGGVKSEEWRRTGNNWIMLGTTTLATKITDAGEMAYDAATHQLVLENDNGTLLCDSPGSSTVTQRRLSGADRVATAVAVSRSAFPTDGSAAAVVLARADAFADALAGGPLAAAKKAPLLLTASGALDVAASAEIQRVLKPGDTVYLLGGKAALSDAIASAVSALGDVPARLAGTDRFGTALAIAEAMDDPPTVFEADGVSFPDATGVSLASGATFPDALAGGPVAGAAGEPTLLVPPTGALPQPDTAYLTTRDGAVGSLRVFGGEAAVGDGVVDAAVGALAGT